MAWAPQPGNNTAYYKETSIALGDTTTTYSSAMDFLSAQKRRDANVVYATFALQASAVTGTNIDSSLYGAYTLTGTKYQLLDAIVADVTDGTFTVGTPVEVRKYTMPYLFIGLLTDADETLNTVTAVVTF